MHKSNNFSVQWQDFDFGKIESDYYANINIEKKYRQTQNPKHQNYFALLDEFEDFQILPQSDLHAVL